MLLKNGYPHMPVPLQTRIVDSRPAVRDNCVKRCFPGRKRIFKFSVFHKSIRSLFSARAGALLAGQ